MPPVVLLHHSLIYGSPKVIQDKILGTTVFFFTGKDSWVSVLWLCDQRTNPITKMAQNLGFPFWLTLKYQQLQTKFPSIIYNLQVSIN